jgi:thiol-disulfide isomerase/thioredoxin
MKECHNFNCIRPDPSERLCVIFEIPLLTILHVKLHIMKIFSVLPAVLLFSFFSFSQEPPILAIGSPAPEFNLPAADGKDYTLDSFKNSKLLVIAFMCNHCPTSQAYEDRMIKLTSDYSGKGVAVVAINPNNPASLRYDELGWSDVGDSFDEMKVRAKDKHFNFPYLYDGETEIASRKYGPVSTPHIFIFDKDRKLRYNGRIDDTENPKKTAKVSDARNAIEALLANKKVPVETTKVFGCSVKWIEKNDWLQKAAEKWARQPVTISAIDTSGIKDLLKNTSDKLRLINIWATWCGPCVAEFPDLITLSRIYLERDFELVSISADEPENKEKALKFLKKNQASNANYIFEGGDKYKLIEAVDPGWRGALPYTILVEPGGKIVYSKQGAIDAEELRKLIFNNHLIGRLYN